MTDQTSADESRRQLWAAVDQLTKPTTRRITRDEELSEQPWVRGLICDVGTYRQAVAGWGTVPSLWDQATAAVRTGGELAEGGQASPKAQRSIADLDLMEQLLTIRETMPWQLYRRGVKPRGGIPDQIRQLASLIVAREPDHVDWWAYRFGQWGRLLGGYLQALAGETKPRQLRISCPECKARMIPIEHDNGPVMEFAIIVNFVGGVIRAATCRACGYARWRGEDLWALADEAAKAPEAERKATA